ncbi:MAG TPA: biosynthetic-type acetolactate synthase large subunit [Bacteroidetes bacterium]|nr:biosynthetic-type acetolactate synthase large subunit [Bacteroidota bacterium]
MTQQTTTTTQRQMTGAEIFVRSLIEENVEIVFGYPGGAVIGIYDALHDISDIKHILTRHEQGAVHAAEGYAKASGRPGVALVTSGPGATNTVTGIADAYMDSIPIVVFTGQVALKLIGNDAFQEADIVGITRPITKHSYLVRDVNELAATIKEAFYVATTGRPGPVLVDLPKDVMATKTIFNYPKSVKLRSYQPHVEGNQKQLDKAVALIAKAKRPVLYVGGGVILSNAAEELKKFAHKTKIPVTTTLHGLGAFPETDELSLGMLGMHGTWYSNTAVNYCDLLIAVGARFDDRVTGKTDAFAPEAKKIHIDVDPSNISKNVKVDVPIVGDVKKVLQQLLPLVSALDTRDWIQTIKNWKEEHPLRYNNGKYIRMQHVIQKISELTKGKAVMVSDVGQHQMWMAQFYQYLYPRTHLTSGGLGTMGFSLPASMGAAFARKDFPIVSISGDGGFQMNIQELATIREYNVPVKIIILNNGYLGMVRQWQELFWRKRYSHVEMLSPDYVKVAEAYGIPGFRATVTSDVDDVIKQLFETDGPALAEFKVVKEDNVYPMIPAGQTYHEIIDIPNEKSEPIEGEEQTDLEMVTFSKG